MAPTVRRKRSRREGPETALVTGIAPADRTPREVGRDFRRLLADGARLRPVGDAKDDPQVLLSRRYVPRHRVSLFDATYYLTDFRFEDGLSFLVAYVALAEADGSVRAVHPRLFYKDSTLVWRVASHVIRTDEEDWIGKGDVKWERGADGEEHLVSDEDSTNLPYEIQGALDVISRRKPRQRDDDAVVLVLRRAPANRIQPYADFSRPRREAEAAHPVNGGRPVARFTRAGDPASLRFTRGYEPDFAQGVVEVNRSASRTYGGGVRKFRILSTNGEVQYQFVAAPSHVWMNPPQTLTTELTTYGVRTLHVPADEHMFIPGYEYHFVDESQEPPELYSQIPAGYAGELNPDDPERADASPWIEAMPVIREFRRRVLEARR